MAKRFKMMPQEAAERLAESGQKRSAALSAGAPGFVGDQYSDEFAAAVSTLWGAHHTEFATNVTTGMGRLPTSAGMPQATEAANTAAAST
jgi:hypothetical protein